MKSIKSKISCSLLALLFCIALGNIQIQAKNNLYFANSNSKYYSINSNNTELNSNSNEISAKLNSFGIDNTTPYAGKSYIITANGTSENGILYKFWLSDLSTGKWTVLQEYSEKNSVTWTPQMEGKYELVVHAKDKLSSNEEDDYKYQYVNVSSAKAKLNNFGIDNTMPYAGKSYIISANGTSENGILYKFWLSDLSTGKWTVLQEYSEKNSVTWTPQMEGKYELVVHAKDKLSSNEEDNYKYQYVNVSSSKAKLNNFGIDNTMPYAGISYIISANGTSENGILYKFWVADLSTGKWTVLQEYSEKNSVTWTPQIEGKYEIVIHAKDKLSSNEEDDYKYQYVNVSSAKAKLNNFGIDNTMPYAGKSYIISANGTSENGIQYKFWVADLSTGKWIVLQEYSEKNSVTWTPQIEGKYEIVVHAKDKLSSNEEDDYKYQYVNVSSAKAKLNNFGIDNTMPYSGKSYIISANGTSENGILYKFWVADLSTGKWTVLQEYSEKNSVTWTTQMEGKYEIVVHAKDKCSAKEEDDYKSQYITVNGLRAQLENFGIDNTAPYAGKSYIITANGTSDNGILYKFWVADLLTGKWTVLQEYSEKNSVGWTPQREGKYEIVVHAKDKYSAKEEDDYKYQFVNVYGSKALVTDFVMKYDDIQKNAYLLGQTYKLFANAVSLNGAMYRLYVCDMLTNKWTMLKDYSDDNFISWTPSSYTRYEFVVHVKDKLSIADLDDYKYFYVKPETNGFKNRIIVIDSGHGGIDSGAVSSSNTGYIKESDLNLSQSYKIGDSLKALGAIVFYTKDYINPLKDGTNKSQAINLQERIDLSDRLDADLFLCIHHDASENKDAIGVSAHYCTYKANLDNSGLYEDDNGITHDSTPCKEAIISQELASELVNSVSSSGLKNRGTYDHNLYVNRWSKTPSVLLELGFMSNDSEVRLVSQSSFQDIIANKIAETLNKYYMGK